MSAFRAETVGIDTHNYVEIFDSGYRLAAYVSEFIYSGLGLLIYDYNEDYRWFQVIMTFFTYLPWFFLLNKKSKYFAVSLILFVFSTNRYFFETFNMVRQAAATPYLLWCWVMLYENKYWKSILCFIIALGFHTSSLIYLPIAFVAYKWRFSNNLVVATQVFTLIFAFVFSDMSVITNLITAILPSGLQELFGVEHYSGYREELARTTFGLLPMLLPNAFITVCYYKTNSDDLLMRIFVYGAVFLNVISVYPMSYRMSYGLIALEVLLFPTLLKVRSPYRNMLKLVIACIVIYSLFDFFTTCDLAKLVPYKTFTM